MTVVTPEYTFSGPLDSNGCTIFANIIWWILWFQNLIIYIQRNLSALSHFNNHVKGMPDLEKGFPCRSAGEESACNAGDLGSIPALGRSPGEGKGYPLQYSGLENSMDCIVHGIAKSWTRLSNFHFHWYIYTWSKSKEMHGNQASGSGSCQGGRGSQGFPLCFALSF